MPLQQVSTWPSLRIPVRSTVVSVLVALVGYARIQIAMGTRMRLEKIQVKELATHLQEGTSLWPGGSAPLVVKAISEDGKEYLTAGAGH